jgi:hypothetical protein
MMTFGQFQAAFRPIVDLAWATLCRTYGQTQDDKAARRSWYEAEIAHATGGRLRSTRSASTSDFQILLAHFSQIAGDAEVPVVEGFKPAQQRCFEALVLSAWLRSRDGFEADFGAWFRRHMTESGALLDVDWRWHADAVAGFDKVMARFAVLADDLFWLNRTAAAPEIRMRHLINEALSRLSDATGTSHTWAYVRGIWTQADLLPEDPADAPAETLRSVLAWLNIHLHRVCGRRATHAQASRTA